MTIVIYPPFHVLYQISTNSLCTCMVNLLTLIYQLSILKNFPKKNNPGGRLDMDL